MRVLIVGGTGLIGQPLVHALVARGDEVDVAGRSEIKIKEIFGDKVGATTLDALTPSSMQKFDAVVNLAGENVGAAMRWSDETIREIEDSRVRLTSTVARLISDSGSSIRLLNSSGISFYGYEHGGESEMDERSGTIKLTPDVLTGVTLNWEEAACRNLPEGHPVVLMRTGVVLAKGAGALGKMELPFRMGAGGRIGSGEQGVSWISLRDCVQAIVFLLDRPEIRGPVNLTAGWVKQAAFAQALASALHRPCLLPAPAFAVRLLLGTGMADALVLSNYRVQPGVLKGEGFVFTDKDITSTLEAIYS
eukprot:TRINITY_DN23196_c0_g1_i1.p1 TRINITY_DN23196_c0_g1~~TRINITY_DN23196_c0_g1_i1.p1  ORF type:complete len:306 (-),score=63.12 TRINITY_DN23196_c0_g1_i1:28-945(-)